MSHRKHPFIFAPVLLAITLSGSAFAEERLTEAAEEERAPVADTPVDEKQAEPAMAAPLNLEALVAPLQILFGGNLVNGVAADAAGFAPADLVAQNDAMMQQFLQQFRPHLMEELGFIRLVCSDLTKEQRPKIKAAGEAGLKKAAKQMADLQNRQNRGLGFQPNAQPEPRKMIREALAKALKETLTPDQMLRYSREATDRTAHRKQAAILSVVSRLDGSLYLTPKQRDAIFENIAANWQEKWEQWLMFSAYGNEYFPTIPDKIIVPQLNAEQKSVWNGLQKIEMGGWWGGNGQVQPNDGWWGDGEGDQNAAQNANQMILNGVQVQFFAVEGAVAEEVEVVEEVR